MPQPERILVDYVGAAGERTDTTEGGVRDREVEHAWKSVGQAVTAAERLLDLLHDPSVLPALYLVLGMSGDDGVRARETFYRTVVKPCIDPSHLQWCDLVFHVEMTDPQARRPSTPVAIGGTARAA